MPALTRSTSEGPNTAAKGLPPLKSLVIFDAAARQLNFKAAAGELHVTPSAVSHQITNLEEFLGVSLFRRIKGKIFLTAAGDDYHAWVRRAFGDLSFATDAIVRKHSTAGTSLKIHVTPTIAAKWLMPRIADFCSRHTDIGITIASSPNYVDFSRQDFDLDIRYGIPNWSGLVIDRLCEERLQPLCSPNLLRKAGKGILAPEDLCRQVLVHSDVNVFTWRDWFERQGLRWMETRRSLHFDRSYLVLAAACDGLGVALESDLLAEREIVEGLLVNPLPDLEPVRLSTHFLVHPPANGRAPLVRAFRDWLFEQLRSRYRPASRVGAKPRPVR